MIYYDGFEQGTFPEDQEWSTVGDGPWELTSERAASGVYSIRSPDIFDGDDLSQKSSNVTIVTGPAWGDGTLVFSVLAGVNQPFDILYIFVDGVERDRLTAMTTEFQTEKVELAPGPHAITWSYKTNPEPLEVFPPVPVGRMGAVFIDDVYFLPGGATIAPAAGPVVELPGVPTGSPVVSDVDVGSTAPSPSPKSPTSSVESPTAKPSVDPTKSPSSVKTGTSSPNTEPTAGPTYMPSSWNPTAFEATTAPVPDGAVYYDGFEGATFPDDPEWSNAGDAPWELTTEQAASGTYSIRSPDLSNEQITPRSSNVTLTYGNASFDGGTLVLSVSAGVELPIDDLSYFVNGIPAGQMAGQYGGFETMELPLDPGTNEVTFRYRFNPNGLDGLQPSSPNHTGAVFIDDVYIVPSSVATDEFFDGFETGDFSALDWSVIGEEEWTVDETNPYEGVYSAHVRTEDISASGEYSQLDLNVDLPAAAFVQFYFYAPVADPFERFDLRVDGQFLRGLSTEDETWAEGGAFLPSGPHVVSWRLARNPEGVPDAALEAVVPLPFRTGEAWLDNVALLGATPSFLEMWESGDFSANPWVLSGDGDWMITDSRAYEGTNSATISSQDMEVDSGVSELSIAIITEQGGKLTFFVLPSVSGPFEEGNVLLDNIKVATYSSPRSDWMAQEIDIQPGKRKVTFQFAKNPGNVDPSQLELIPSPPGKEGAIWLDRIEFVANVAQS